MSRGDIHPNSSAEGPVAEDPAAPEHEPVDGTALQAALDGAIVRRILAAEIEVDELDRVVVTPRFEPIAIER